MIISSEIKINPFSKINIKNSQNFEISSQDIQDLMPSSDDIHCSCPSCGAKDFFSYHGSYQRNFSFLYHDELCNIRLTVTRVICNSCGHTHACLPSFIVPYRIISYASILSIVSQATQSTVLQVAEKLQISFELIYYYISLLLSFFPQVDLLNKHKNHFKNFNKKYLLLNCNQLCNNQFIKEYFLFHHWIFLMTKFQNTTSPPIQIGLI